MSIRIKTPKFRVSYPFVFKPRKNTFKENAPAEYSLVALFPKDADLAPILKAIEDAKEEKWGADKKKWPKNLRSPLRDQAERAKTTDTGEKYMPDGYEAGAKFITLKNKDKPGLVDQSGKRAITDPVEFYGGCYARAFVSFSAYNHMGNCGITAYLEGLQKLADGEPFGNRVKIEDMFEPVEADEAEADSIFA